MKVSLPNLPREYTCSQSNDCHVREILSGCLCKVIRNCFNNSQNFTTFTRTKGTRARSDDWLPCITNCILGWPLIWNAWWRELSKMLRMSRTRRD